MIDPETRARLRDIKGITTAGEGEKWIADTNTKRSSIVVGVEYKKPKYELKKRDVVPVEIKGVETDVIETHKIWALGVMPLKALAFDQRMRPFPAGISGGHPKITAGTIGCFCKKGSLTCILTNNHVAANCNDANIEDGFYQPAVYDTGSLADDVGGLLDFEILKFIGEENSNCVISKVLKSSLNFLYGLLGRKTRFKTYSTNMPINYMDAAIVRIDNLSLIKDEILKIGKIVGVSVADIGMEDQKTGRTTEYTKDKVIQKNVSTIVEYGAGRQCYFEGQFMSGPMCQAGDSGSAILDMNKNIIGLLFAGSDLVTIFSPIQKVIDRFGLEF
ncbi:MAG: hypothetical protein COX41_06325 [Candidatus Omnitrophica bacterium CG23_combo_of_CG06-09_8_20_14_all_41_10]|uniref:Peptidase S1 domain-containing protein n=1 Tax=Candidatus Sherwoodlollariibacterium unditelluris TaxID=1974757 RepID=A0A2G9YHU2_9BACT|nr:MAG: hypothetical protein COX41_06325 [Candidatus Omnitrophica bacterium CG23_combo_of_CG06-09_8_20_14_all_41_10]